MGRGHLTGRNSTPRKKVAGPSGESQIQAALAFLTSLPPHKINYSSTAKKFSINVCTLHNREAQEEVVLDWMCFQAEEGRLWGREKLKLKVKKLTGREPSDDWVKAFKSRHKEVLKFCGTSGLDPKRCQAFNKTTMDDHFKKLGEVLKKYKYRILLNVDETGMQRGGGRKRTGKKYFVSRRSRMKYKKCDANLELVTIIECACSDGTMLDPGFIFQGKTYEEEWFRNYPHISVGLTQNGWTDDLQCLEWFRKSLVPQARAKALTPDEPILLILDGHGSHLTKELHQVALEHNIHLFQLPAHTSNKTQPLDVGVFGPLSRKWIARNEEIVEETGSGMPKHTFVDEYMAVRKAAITPEIVKAAFRKSGISPFDPNVFMEEDFAPSRTTSIIAHMPPSYPVPDTSPHPVESATSLTEPEASSSSASMVVHGDQCAVGANGELVDASQIRWFFDADDEVPMASHNTPHPPDVTLAIEPSLESQSTSTSRVDDPLPVADVPETDAPMLVDKPSSTSGCENPRALSTTNVPEFSRTYIDRRWSLAKQYEVLSADMNRLEEFYLAEFRRRQMAEVQCELARQEIGTLRTQLHRRGETAGGRKGKQLQTEAQFLMSDEALALFAQKRQDAEAREQAEQEKQAEKARVERETADRRTHLAADPSVRFNGSLKSKRKTDLEDIASLLSLPLGRTVPDLIDSIKTALVDTASHRKSDPRFAGLYNTYNFKDSPSLCQCIATSPDNTVCGAPAATAATALPHSPTHFPESSSDGIENRLPNSVVKSPSPRHHITNAPFLSYHERQPFSTATNTPFPSTSHQILGQPHFLYSETISGPGDAGPSSSTSFNHNEPPYFPPFA